MPANAPIDDPLASRSPAISQRLFLWLLVGGLSTFFATMRPIAGTYAAPPDDWYFAVWRLGLHLLVLAPFAWQRGRVRLDLLYLLGVIVGLHEAYMTKLLFAPPDAAAGWRLAGIDLGVLVCIVLFWHPVVSVIWPIVLVENTLLRSRDVTGALTAWLRQPISRTMAIITVAAIAAVMIGLATESFLEVLLATLSLGVIAVAIIMIWRRAYGDHAQTWQALWPGRITTAALALLLVGDYILYARLYRPAALPGFLGHVTVAVLYVIIIALSIAVARSHRQHDDAGDDHATHPDTGDATPDASGDDEGDDDTGDFDTWLIASPRRIALLFTIIMVLGAWLASLILGAFRMELIALTKVLGGLTGLALLGRIAWRTLRRSPR